MSSYNQKQKQKIFRNFPNCVLYFQKLFVKEKISTKRAFVQKYKDNIE
jgi:hypothetical protein